MELIKTRVSDLAAKLNVSSEDLKAYLTDNDSEEGKSIGESLPKLEVFTAEQLTQRDENIKKSAAKDVEKGFKGVVLGDIDKHIQSVTGVEKNDGESTKDYQTRAFAEKYKADGKKPNEEIESLKAKLSEKDTALKNALKEAENIKSQYSEKEQKFLIDQELNSALSTIKIDVPDNLLPGQQRALRVNLTEDFKPEIVEGKVYAVGKDGKLITDEKTAEPIPYAQIVAMNAQNYVPVKTEDAAKPKGSGVQTKPIDSSGKPGSIDYSDYPTKEAFKEHLNKSGISLNSAEGQKMYLEYINHEKGYAETK